MIKLAKELSDKKIPFEWHVFTNKSDIDSDFFIARKPKLNIINDIAEADYLVQLSDSEGYCYSIVEALSVRTPVICTDIPVLKEIGVNENNSYILNMDMSNTNVDEIYKKIPKIENYKAPECLLLNYINKTKSKYEEERKMKYKVKALDTYKRMNVRDEQLNRVPEPGEEFIVSTDRLEVLSGNNSYEVKFVEVVEKIEETEQIETAVKDIKTEKAIKKTTKKKTK
jgi:glycosyltransferase involved in cell wall biosynthesis